MTGQVLASEAQTEGSRTVIDLANFFVQFCLALHACNVLDVHCTSH